MVGQEELENDKDTAFVSKPATRQGAVRIRNMQLLRHSVR